MSGIIGTLSSIGMAVGPPLVYADQAYSIVKKKDSTGFSHDTCGVILIANVIRIFFWLGERFELPLLVQSLLLIIAHLFLLALCLHYRPHDPTEGGAYAPLGGAALFDEAEAGAGDGAEAYEARTSRPPPPPPGAGGMDMRRARGWMDAALSGARGKKGRPWDFWQWPEVGSYLEFLAGLIVVLGVLQLIFGRWWWYIDALGFIALSIESTLPIPQFISNYRRKSCYGFRISTLAGWLGGDTFKTVYFFLRGSPIQFKVTAIMTVCWDIGVAIQRWKYGSDPPPSAREHEHAEENRGLRVGD